MAFINSAPIYRIPTETLDNILTLAVGMEKEAAAAGESGCSTVSWVKKRLVSQTFHRVLERNKHLWDDVVAFHPDLTALFLTRAANPKVRLRCMNPGKAEKLFTVLRSFSYKILSLDITIRSAMWVEFCNGQAWNFPKLQKLELSTYEVGLPVPPSAVLPITAPALKDLRVTFLYPSTIETVVSHSRSLERLEIRGNLKMPANDVSATLLMVPDLKHLALCATVKDDNTMHDVALPHLQTLDMAIRSTASANVLARLDFPTEATTIIEIEHEDLSSVRDIARILAPKVNKIVASSQYRKCRLEHINTSYTKLSFSPAPGETGAGEAPAEPRLDIIMSTYRDEEEGQVYDALAETLRTSFAQVTELDIEDMDEYNEPGLLPSRHLIGPFPSRLIRVLRFREDTTRRNGHRPIVVGGWELVCSRVKKIQLNHVRFRPTFLASNEDDFIEL
ncbi:hypothetical protein OE88DRAFT_1662437, partial [Heliocybe sulcata]